MTDSTTFLLTVLMMAGLVIGLWLGKALSDSRWEAAARTAHMPVRSSGGAYYVVREGDVERAEHVAALVRAGGLR